jgi:uncharacterized protein (AIM24 family)
MKTTEVTRFEIVDHRPCEECEGTGWVAVPMPKTEEALQQQCIGCSGMGIAGRTVVAYDENLQFDVELQDGNRTLKVFIHPRYE